MAISQTHIIAFLMFNVMYHKYFFLRGREWRGEAYGQIDGRQGGHRHEHGHRHRPDPDPETQRDSCKLLYKINILRAWHTTYEVNIAYMFFGKLRYSLHLFFKLIIWLCHRHTLLIS